MVLPIFTRPKVELSGMLGAVPWYCLNGQRPRGFLLMHSQSFDQEWQVRGCIDTTSEKDRC